MTTVEQAELAKALELDAEDYPDERGEILLEAAGAWVRAGQPERAERLLTQVIDGGGKDACYARVEMAERLFARGSVAEAEAQLGALARDPALHDGACSLAAELMEQRGAFEEALRWYDRAVARLSQDQLDAVRGPDGWMSINAAMILRSRRALREQLGLPPDATDEATPETPDDPFGVKPWRQRVTEQVRMLTFQRAERAEARRRWPEVYTETDEEYYPAAECRWRETAESGMPSMRIVPGVVADLVAFAESIGGSPTDFAVKEQYVNSVPEGRLLRWPPQRNAPCWCGSGVKYKKCCGRAG